jgi:uncharacterized membrane protein YbhN (UPF0104 family)
LLLTQEGARYARLDPDPADLTRDASAVPGPRERGYQKEVADPAPGETAGDHCASRTECGPATAGPARRGRKIIRTAASAILIAATFGFAIPRIASYRSVWASIQMMTWPHIVLIAAAAAASLASYWVTIRAVLPRLNLRQAATVNLGSNAVANTLPAGGALAMGVSWAMLSSWGLSTADFVLYTLVTGIWNVFILLGLPVLALLVMTTATRPDAVLIIAAATGLAVLAVMVIGLGLLLNSQAFALRAGRALQRLLTVASRLARRPPPGNPAGSLSSFRDRAGALLAVRGWRITAATVASYLALWLVLLACLRGTGLSQAQMPWQTSLAAFAFIRLLTALPITPGGLGVTELGLVGILATSAGSAASVQVTAAVLLYRAVTYLPPIPLGALACLTWRVAPALTGTSRYRASPVSAPHHDRTGPLRRTSSAPETASQPSVQPAPADG